MGPILKLKHPTSLVFCRDSDQEITEVVSATPILKEQSISLHQH